MAINDKITDEKVQYDINREAAKISALSSDKTDKYVYFTCKEETLPPGPSQIIQYPKFTYFPLEEAFAKASRKTN